MALFDISGSQVRIRTKRGEFTDAIINALRTNARGRESADS